MGILINSDQLSTNNGLWLPNYNNPIPITSLPFTAPCPCLAFLRFTRIDWSYVIIYVNNNSVDYDRNDYSDKLSSCGFQIWLNTNDVVSFETDTQYVATFQPSESHYFPLQLIS